MSTDCQRKNNIHPAAIKSFSVDNFPSIGWQESSWYKTKLLFSCRPKPTMGCVESRTDQKDRRDHHQQRRKHQQDPRGSRDVKKVLLLKFLQKSTILSFSQNCEFSDKDVAFAFMDITLSITLNKTLALAEASI